MTVRTRGRESQQLLKEEEMIRYYWCDCYCYDDESICVC